MLNYIPQIKLTAEEKEEYSSVIRKGNSILAKHSDRILGKRKRRVFRQQLLNDEIDLKKNGITQKDANAVKAVKNLEWKMMCSCAGLMRKIATRWWSLTKDFTGAEDEDYGHTAIISFNNALFAFSDKAVSNGKIVAFSTFAYRVMNNGMIDFVAKSNTLSGLSVSDFIKKGKFEQFCQENADSGLTYDELVEKAGYSDDEIKAIEACKKYVVSESQMTESHMGATPFEIGDYTGLSSENKKCPEKLVEPDMLSAIFEANLSKVELDVLKTSLSPYWGWQSDVAARHINPNTCKPYNRQWVNFQIPKIYAKVRAAYNPNFVKGEE